MAGQRERDLTTPNESVLANGLSVVRVPLEGSGRVCVSVSVRRGPRDEPAGQSGITRLLADLFFTGTAAQPDTQTLLEEIDSLGAEPRVEVFADRLRFSLDGQAGDADRLVRLMAELVCQPGLAAGDVRATRARLLSALGRRDNEPSTWLQDHLPAASYEPGGGLDRAVAGRAAAIRRLTNADLRRFRERLFNPTDMLVVIAGDAHLGDDVLEAGFGGLRPQLPTRRLRPVWRRVGIASVAHVVPVAQGDDPQVTLQVASPGISEGDPDVDAARMVAMIASTRMYQSVRSSRGLAYYVSAVNVSISDAASFTVTTAAHPDRAAPALAEAINQLRLLAGEPDASGRRHPVRPVELARARATVGFSLDTRTEAVVGAAGFAADRWLQGLPQITASRRIAQYERVTMADITRVARRIADQLDQARVGFVGPTDQSQAFEAAMRPSGARGLGR